MKSRLGLALAVSTIVASGGLLGATAYAQQQPTPPAMQKSSPAPTASGAQMAAPSRSEKKPDMASGKAFRDRALAKLSKMSPADRAAFLDARLAAVKAGLELTADQEKLWAPVEQTVRDGVAQAVQMRQKFAGGQQAANPIQRLRRISEITTARANFLRSFADAAQPFYAKLTPAQKHRLPMLMHGMGGPPGRMGMGMGGKGGEGMMSGRMREMMHRCMKEGMMRGRMGEHKDWDMRGSAQGHMREGWRDHDRHDGGRRRSDSDRRDNNSDSRRD